MNQRRLIVLILCSVCAFFLLREQERGTFAQVDEEHLSWLMGNRESGLPKPLETPIVLLQWDDLNKEADERMQAADWADLFRRIVAYKTRGVAVEPALVWQDTDAELAKAALELPKLCLGAVVRKESVSELEAAPSSAFPLPELARISGETAPVPEFNLGAAIPSVRDASALGISQVDLGGAASRVRIEGETCRLPLLFQKSGRVYPSLALQLLSQEVGVPVTEAAIEMGKRLVLGKRLIIPIDATGSYQFTLYRTNIRPLTILKLDTVRLEQKDVARFAPKEEREKMEAMAGAICYIGVAESAPRFAWPDGKAVTGSELTVHAIRSILTGRNFRPASLPAQWGFLAPVILLAAWMAGKSRKLVGLWSVVGMLPILLTTLLAFQSNAVWLTLAPAACTWALGALVCFLTAPAKRGAATVKE